jgi:excisionase family DNA binding protein
MSVSLLTPDEVAALCGYSRKAIYRAIERGEPRATKRCSRWRISARDVELWLEDGVPLTDNGSGTARGRTLPPVALPRGSFGALLASEEECA